MKILSKYFNVDTTMRLIYRNGGIIPASYGEVIGDSFGCGLKQDEFLLLLYFYGGFSLLTYKDPEEAEQLLVEIGNELLEKYDLTDDEKTFIQTKYVDKYVPEKKHE